jgi:hypothetical protein
MGHGLGPKKMQGATDNGCRCTDSCFFTTDGTDGADDTDEERDEAMVRNGFEGSPDFLPTYPCNPRHPFHPW